MRDEAKCRQGQVLQGLKVPGKRFSVYHQKCHVVKGLELGRGLKEAGSSGHWDMFWRWS